MPNLSKSKLIAQMEGLLGRMHKLPNSNSMFVVGEEAARVYLRYSKMHAKGRTFFGLRQVDLRQLEGRNSFIAFFTDDGSLPILLPYAAFERVFQEANTASDGQYKVQLLREHGTSELYIPKQGRFNVNAYTGLETIQQSIAIERLRDKLVLTHCQVQTLLGAIGTLKGFDVFVPASDACSLDWSLVPQFPVRREIPAGFTSVAPILSEIDLLWVARGSSHARLFAGAAYPS